MQKHDSKAWYETSSLKIVEYECIIRAFEF